MVTFNEVIVTIFGLSSSHHRLHVITTTEWHLGGFCFEDNYIKPFFSYKLKSNFSNSKKKSELNKKQKCFTDLDTDEIYWISPNDDKRFLNFVVVFEVLCDLMSTIKLLFAWPSRVSCISSWESLGSNNISLESKNDFRVFFPRYSPNAQTMINVINSHRTRLNIVN